MEDTAATSATCAVTEPVPNDVMLVALDPSTFHSKWSHVLDHVTSHHTTLRQVTCYDR